MQEMEINVEPENFNVNVNTDYNILDNKPKINDITLEGNKTLDELGIVSQSEYDSKVKELEQKDSDLNSKINDIEGNYITKEVNDLTNYKNNTELTELLEEKANTSDIPSKISQLDNDAGYLTEYIENDPTVPSHVKNISEDDIENWNKKSDFSGSYNDLSDKPEPYVLPIASNDTLGGIKVGIGLEVTEDGKLNATGEAVATNIAWENITDKPEEFKPEHHTHQASDIEGISVEESDPTVPSYVKSISEADISNWNNKAEASTIPTAISQLENDKNYIDNTVNDLQNYQNKEAITALLNAKANKEEIPKNTSDLQNDSDFITSEDLPTKTSELQNDSGFITSEDIPKDISSFNNDSNFIDNTVDDLINYYKNTEIDDKLLAKADKSEVPKWIQAESEETIKAQSLEDPNNIYYCVEVEEEA